MTTTVCEYCGSTILGDKCSSCGAHRQVHLPQTATKENMYSYNQWTCPSCESEQVSQTLIADDVLNYRCLRCGRIWKTETHETYLTGIKIQEMREAWSPAFTCIYMIIPVLVGAIGVGWTSSTSNHNDPLYFFPILMGGCGWIVTASLLLGARALWRTVNE